VTLLPIGRFAKASRLSVKSLRNYDDSGLLKAAFVDPANGYRYYRIEQLVRASTIRSLRLIDMPLAMIETLLDKPDGSDMLHSFLQTLQDERLQQEKRIRDLQHLIATQELTMTNAVTIKFIDPQQVAAHRQTTTYKSVFTDIPNGFANVFGFLERTDASPVGAPFTLFHEFPEGDNEGEISLCVPIRQALQSADGIEVYEMLGGAVASIVHRGSYESMDASYAHGARWIHIRGHRVVAPSREIYLNSPADTSEDDLLTEIQWPIDVERNETERRKPERNETYDGNAVQ
jgi:effector-binding domain-containing protein